MKINNRFNIGEQVRWGPNIGIVTGIMFAGSKTNILYDIRYFDTQDVGESSLVYEIELESLQGEIEMGFRGKEK